MRILLKILLRILLNWRERYLQISMKNRSISRAEQKQKQQDDIDFASVCCFKLFEFELFEFLLIGAFWLAADLETKNHWRQRTDDCEEDGLIWSCSRFIELLFFISSCDMLSYRCCVIDSFSIDVDCEDVKNRKNACTFEVVVTNSLRSMRARSQNVIEAKSLVVVANSLNAIEANRSLRQERSETKRKSKFLIDVLSVDLMIEELNVKLLLCVISISLFNKRCFNVSKKWVL